MVFANVLPKLLEKHASKHAKKIQRVIALLLVFALGFITPVSGEPMAEAFQALWPEISASADLAEAEEGRAERGASADSDGNALSPRMRGALAYVAQRYKVSAEAVRPVGREAACIEIEAAALERAMAALPSHQHLQKATGATHAAAWCAPDGEVLTVREDVGRHNALDKLAGALARDGIDAGQGAIVMSSRLSVDLVQKAARIGAPVLIGASAPTGLALDWAERAGITLIARARGASFDLYTHPRRIAGSRGQ